MTQFFTQQTFTEAPYSRTQCVFSFHCEKSRRSSIRKIKLYLSIHRYNLANNTGGGGGGGESTMDIGNSDPSSVPHI